MGTQGKCTRAGVQLESMHRVRVAECRHGRKRETPRNWHVQHTAYRSSAALTFIAFLSAAASSWGLNGIAIFRLVRLMWGDDSMERYLYGTLLLAPPLLGVALQLLCTTCVRCGSRREAGAPFLRSPCLHDDMMSCSACLHGNVRCLLAVCIPVQGPSHTVHCAPGCAAGAGMPPPSSTSILLHGSPGAVPACAPLHFRLATPARKPSHSAGCTCIIAYPPPGRRNLSPTVLGVPVACLFAQCRLPHALRRNGPMCRVEGLACYLALERMGDHQAGAAACSYRHNPTCGHEANRPRSSTSRPRQPGHKLPDHPPPTKEEVKDALRSCNVLV